MAGKRLGLREVRAIGPNETVWDTAVRGFGARRQKGGAVAYILKYRNAVGRQCWYTIGRHGAPWTPDAARDEFPGISGRLLPEDNWSLNDDKLRATDREFLQTWIDDYANDPIWKEIIAEARQFNDSRKFHNLSLIWYALRARRLAEDVGSGVDALQRERQKRHDELLALADTAGALTRFWREAQMRCARLDPFSPSFPIPFEQVLQFQKLNEDQAQFLRQIAGDPPSPSTRISRQSRGKKRDRTRECTAFMFEMVGHMHEICGKPHYTVVATMTNIAFPKADVSVDDVRLSARRATTRSGRRRKTDPLSAKKSA